jgi:hypothetical protein
MKTMLSLALAGSLLAVLPAAAQSQAAVQAAQKACRADAMSVCSGTPRTGMMACLLANKDKISQACVDALAAVEASK